MRILVAGDIMIDRYTYVRTSRNAAEAPIPVWDEVGDEIRPGGAANLARNLKALGGPDIDVHLCGIMGGIVGDYHSMLKGYGLNTDFVTNGTTMVKHRFVDADTKKYLFRHDNFRKFDPAEVDWFETVMDGHTLYSKFDAVVISDYNKGTVTPRIAEFMKNFPITVVDSKREDVSIFDGMNVLKLNEHEWSAQVSSKLYPNFSKFFEYCVVTKGEKGATLLQCEQIKSGDRRYIVHQEDFPTEPKKAVDVTGCGDTFTAALAFSVLKTRDIRSAVKFANTVAGQKVQKFGTETP